MKNLDELELKYRSYIEKTWGAPQPDGSYKRKQSWGNLTWDAPTWRKIMTLRSEANDYINNLNPGDKITINYYGSRGLEATITKVNYKRGTKTPNTFSVDIINHYSENCIDKSLIGKPHITSGRATFKDIHDGLIVWRGVEIWRVFSFTRLNKTGWNKKDYDNDIWEMLK